MAQGEPFVTAMPDLIAARRLLHEGACELGLELSDHQNRALCDYLQLLVAWNRAYNLMATRDPLEVVTRHLLDSLSVLPWISGSRIVDVGSGAGLPGIPLAIMRPAQRFTLLDSNGKRCKFLFQAKLALQLPNVDVHRGRCEAFFPSPRYDTVISRAFADIAKLCRLAGHLCADRGSILAMKGKPAARELSAALLPYNVTACHQLEVPGLDAHRVLVVINRHGGENA